MTFDWNNFVSIAAYLKDNCDGLSIQKNIDREATFRTVINRAYYAAYNVSVQYALKEFGKISDGDGGNHARLIKTFQDFKHEKAEYKDIAVKLSRIKNYRIKADYNANFINGQPSYAAHDTMKTSQEIISSINSL